MKLHQRTINKCERLYETKAEAHFYGIGAGVLLSAAAVLLATVIYRLWL